MTDTFLYHCSGCGVFDTLDTTTEPRDGRLRCPECLEPMNLANAQAVIA